ncbi:MAG: hypothetical protein H7X99_08800 [Saprospiraceae bacterium]|nr:hypothetical protein [Saprospiraceae bacterium]
MNKSLNQLLMSCITCVVWFNVYGQSYDYSKFRFPEVKVKGLNGAAYLYGSAITNKNSNYGYNSGSLNYSIYGNYFRFINDKENQKLDRFNLNHTLYYDKNPSFILQNQEKEIKERNLNIELIKEMVWRKYSNNGIEFLGVGNSFIEMDYNVGVYFSDNFYKSDINDYYQQSLELNTTIPFKFGFGRIEPMDDVFLAQFLMDDLMEAGLIVERLSEEKLFELAQLMSFVRNQRVFDFRKARVFRLTEIAGWLEKNGIPQNIKSFTVMNDNWQSAFLNTRSHGKRISLGLIPWVDYTWNKYNNQNGLDNTNLGIGIQAEYYNSKAKNQYSQSDVTLSFIQNYQDIQYIEYHFVSNLFAGYRYSYNPNSRTTYSIEPSLDYYLLEFKDQALNLNVKLSANYFINNRARITTFLGTGFSRAKDDFVNVIRRYPFNANFITELQELRNPLNTNVFIHGNQFSLFGNLSFNYAFF